MAGSPFALRVYVRAIGLQPCRRHGHNTKASFEVLKMDQNGGRPSRRVKGRLPYPPPRPVLHAWQGGKEWKHAAPPHPLRHRVMVALTTGLRRGEILGLKWDYVSLESRFILLPITKNNTSRAVPFNETLYRILAQMPQK